MSAQDPYAKYGGSVDPYAKYGGAAVTPASAPTLMTSRQEASKQELEANKPESTMLSRAREAAIGILQPFDLHNVPDLVKSVSGAFYDMLTGKGSAAGQELVKGAVTAPVQPAAHRHRGIR